MMTALTATVVARTGGADISTGMVAATNGDTIPAGCSLHVKNASGSPVTVTWVAPAGTGPSGTSLANLALTPAVPATTGDVIFANFDAVPWSDPNTGLVTFNYSATASVTVKALLITD
jgi:hypothetical protein